MKAKERFPFELVDRADWPRADRKRKKRIRKPSLRGVLAQAKRAGVEVGSIEVTATGSIVLTPGTPVRDVTECPTVASEWN